MKKSESFKILFHLTTFITLSFSLDLACFYNLANYGSHFTEKIYQCTVTDDPNIQTRNVVIEHLIGNHTDGKEAKDVTGIHIKHKNVSYFPSGIGILIPNLIGLSVQNTKLKEITQNDLKQFPKMQHLFIVENEVRRIEKDLLKYNPELIYVNLRENFIKSIDPSVFGGLKKLIGLVLTRNVCIDKSGENSKEIKEVVAVVKENCKAKIPINGTCKTSVVNWGYHLKQNIYECTIINDFEITSRNYELDYIMGDHQGKRTAVNISGIHIKNKVVNFLPDGIGEIMPKIIGLSIESCQLLEITQKDLKMVPKLLHLWLIENTLKVLEKDLFKYNPNLIYINLKDNDIKTVDPAVFDNLKSLKILIMLHNTCVDSEAKSAQEIIDFIEIIADQCGGKIKPKEPEKPSTGGKVQIPTDNSDDDDDDDDKKDEFEIEGQGMSLWIKIGVIGGIIWLVVGVGCSIYCIKKRCT